MEKRKFSNNFNRKMFSFEAIVKIVLFYGVERIPASGAYSQGK